MRFYVHPTFLEELNDALGDGRITGLLEELSADAYSRTPFLGLELIPSKWVPLRTFVATDSESAKVLKEVQEALTGKSP